MERAGSRFSRVLNLLHIPNPRAKDSFHQVPLDWGLTYMMHNGIQKAVYRGEGGGGIRDGAGRPVGCLDLSFGSFVLSLSFPEFEGKPDSSTPRVDISDQLRDYRLKNTPEVNEKVNAVRVSLLGAEDKTLIIRAKRWSYYKGLHI